MAGKSVEQLQSEYDAALAKEHDNPGDERVRKAAGTAARRLTEARSAARDGRPALGVVADDETPED